MNGRLFPCIETRVGVAMCALGVLDGPLTFIIFQKQKASRSLDVVDGAWMVPAASHAPHGVSYALTARVAV
jgi:hypothetical protein